MNRKLTAREICQQLNIKIETWRNYYNKGYAPKPDGYFEDNHAAWWWESTITEWVAQRKGRGWWRKGDQT